MYLLDSDVARKLCQYQLVHELARALKCPLAGFAVLPQLAFQLRLRDPHAALKKLGSVEAVTLATELVSLANVVELKVEQSNYALNIERPDIDSGEAVLFAALHQSDQDSLLSGDKRAFVALSKINDELVAGCMWARMICLEEAIMIILKGESFELVSTKIRARTDVDSALSSTSDDLKPWHKKASSRLYRAMSGLERDTDGKWVTLCVKHPHCSTGATT